MSLQQQGDIVTATRSSCLYPDHEDKLIFIKTKSGRNQIYGVKLEVCREASSSCMLKMSHLLLLYVTLEQENAIRNFFHQKEWNLKEIDIEALQSNHLTPGVLPLVGHVSEAIKALHNSSTQKRPGTTAPAEDSPGITVPAEDGPRSAPENGIDSRLGTTEGQGEQPQAEGDDETIVVVFVDDEKPATISEQNSSRLQRVLRSTNKTEGVHENIISKKRPNPRPQSFRGRRLPGRKARTGSKLQKSGKDEFACELAEISTNNDECKLQEIDKDENILPVISNDGSKLPVKACSELFVTGEDTSGSRSLISDASLLDTEKLDENNEELASLHQSSCMQERLDANSDEAENRLSVEDYETCTEMVHSNQVTESHSTDNLTESLLNGTHNDTHEDTVFRTNGRINAKTQDGGCDGKTSGSGDTNIIYKTQCRTALKMKIGKGRNAFPKKKKKGTCFQNDQVNSVNEALKKPHSHSPPDLSVTKVIGKNVDVNVSSKKGKKRPVYCSDCKTMFTSQRRYDGHKEKNGGQCVFKCEYCGKVFLYRKSKYLIHIRSAHTKERPFTCDICDKAYVTSDKLKIHKRTHTGEKPCVCEQCGKSFYSRADLSIHRDYHHTSRQNLADFVCNQCNITFCSKRYLVYHKTVTHSSRRDFNCTKCEKQFKCKTALQRHLKYIHSESRDYKCEKCNKSFKSPNCLRKHTVRHREEKGFYCSYCDKGFYEKSKLVQHERVHTGEKPYRCDLCDYRCALSGNLSKHRKTHYKSL